MTFEKATGTTKIISVLPKEVSHLAVSIVFGYWRQSKMQQNILTDNPMTSPSN